MASGKSVKGTGKHKNEMECENSYCWLAGKNMAFNIHLHTSFHAIYGGGS